MKYRHLLLAFGIATLAACSDPVAPRLPQPEEEEDEDPDSPGVQAMTVADPNPLV